MFAVLPLTTAEEEEKPVSDDEDDDGFIFAYSSIREKCLSVCCHMFVDRLKLNGSSVALREAQINCWI